MSTTARPLADPSTPSCLTAAERLSRRFADPSKPLDARLATIRGYVMGYAQVPGVLRGMLSAGVEPAVTSIIENYNHLARVHLFPLDVGNALAATRTGAATANVEGIEPIHAATAAKALVTLERAVALEFRLRAIKHHFYATGEIIEHPTAVHLIAAALQLEPLLRGWEREAARLRADTEVEFARAVAAAEGRACVVPAGDQAKESKQGKRSPELIALLEYMRTAAGGDPLGPARLKAWANDQPDAKRVKPPTGFRVRFRELLTGAKMEWPKSKAEWKALNTRYTSYAADRPVSGRQP